MPGRLGIAFDRRKFITYLTSSALLSGAPAPCFRAIAQERPRSAVTASDQVAALEARASAAGFQAMPGESARTIAPENQNDYSELLPRLLDLIDGADTSRSAHVAIAEQAAELLGRLHRAERSFAPDDDARAPLPNPDDLKEEYRRLFDACQILPAHADKVERLIVVLKRHRDRHEAVGKRLGIPWYFIGGVHLLEGGCNFTTHLHNGDPLAQRTVNEPKRQPVDWNPPTDWESSAVDALRAKRYNDLPEWSLESTLYRWERFNGFGYRSRRHPDGRPVYTPYLWSFSNHYTKGKFGNYSPLCVGLTRASGIEREARD